MKYDYTVVGGGVSGMTCALILAKNGFKVALIEKSERLAPVIRGFMRKDVYFDTGFHYTGGLGTGEPVDTFFRYLNLLDSIQKVPLRPDGFDVFRCHEPDTVFHFPYGYERIVKHFNESFPGDEGAIRKYFAAVKEHYHSVPYVNLETDGAAPRFSDAGGPTLREFLDGLTDNAILKCVLSMHCFLYGVAPAEVSFANHAYVAGSYYESAHAVRGGGKEIASAFESQLNNAGVDIYCSRAATAITISTDGTLSGVRLEDGTDLTTNGCISTVHPLEMLKIAPDSIFRPAYVNRLKELQETPSACILYAVCKEPLRELEGSNIFMFPRPRFDFFSEDVPMSKRPMYITAAGERSDWRQSRYGFITICPVSREQAKFLMDPVSRGRSAQYSALKESMSNEMMEAIRYSYPDMVEKITDVICATPLTLRDYMNSPFGSLYGVQHRIGQLNPLPLTRLRGLFLAGQAVTAPGLMGAMISAFVACGAIMGDEKIKQELKRCRIEE